MNAKQIDELAGRAMKAFGVPGMALAVVKNGRLVYANGYGVRSVDSRMSSWRSGVMQFYRSS